jgi:carbamoyltransferase
LAASIQKVTEEVLVKLAKNIAKKTGERNLCLAGGVALNCVANGKLLREQIFDGIWIQPASGDAGGAVGAALAAYHMHLDQKRTIPSDNDGMKGSYLGPSFTDAEVTETLTKHKAVFHKFDHDKMIEAVALSLAAQKAVGWMQGRMEFGPRALGNRSIIADPRSKTMQKQLNLMVKYRESFRPFAPSVLVEDVSEWFEIEIKSPYMLFVADIKENKRIEMSQSEMQLFGIDKLNIPRSEVPSVTHVDYSARLQTVHSDTNPVYHKLISTFREKTGCPMLINTSFNVRGEPIVCSPEDALR